MSNIHIRRQHTLGRAAARKVALAWAERAQQKLDMLCTVSQSRACDTVEFSRIGVRGTLQVTADRFELQAKLGFFLIAFGKAIEAEIEKQLDAELARAAGEQKKRRPT